MRGKKKETKKEFDLQEACVLWLHTSKTGVQYLKGHDLNNNKVIGFFNETSNEKQPKVRIFSLKENGESDKEIITLWKTESLKKNTYLSGYTDEKENVIGFYGDIKNEKLPYLRVYFKDEN